MAFELNKEINRKAEEWIAEQEKRMNTAFKIMNLKYTSKNDLEWADARRAFMDAARMFYWLGREHGASVARHDLHRAIGVK
ncbi:hypothetical protein ACFLXA_01810 [Chloroflexota bacterium]